MPRKPGNLNPDSASGNARLGTGRGSNSGRSQPSGANKAVPAPKRFKAPIVDEFSKNPLHLRSEAEKLIAMSQSASMVESARLRYAANNLILRARGLEKKAK